MNIREILRSLRILRIIIDAIAFIGRRNRGGGGGQQVQTHPQPIDTTQAYTPSHSNKQQAYRSVKKSIDQEVSEEETTEGLEL